MIKSVLTASLLLLTSCVFSQSIIDVRTSPAFSTSQKYASLAGVCDDEKGNVVAALEIRDGRFAKISGYEIVRFDAALKKQGSKTVSIGDRRNLGVIMDGQQIKIIEFTYDKSEKAYICTAQVADVKELSFSRKELFRLDKDEVDFRLLTKTEAFIEDKDQVATIYFSEDKKSFAVSVDLLKHKATSAKIFVVDPELKVTAATAFFREEDRKKYWMENITVANDGQSAYLTARKFLKKKKKAGNKFDYEITAITKDAPRSQIFETGEHYFRGFQLVDRPGNPFLAALYSDRDERICDGVFTAGIDRTSLAVSNPKYELFTRQFQEDDSDKQNALFAIEDVKVELAENNDIIITAEEDNFQIIGGSSSYSYGDVASIRLDENGKLLYSRRVDKAQHTNGSRNEYLSYYSAVAANSTFIFVNGKPEKSKDGSQTYKMPSWPASADGGLYMIRFDETGDMTPYLVPEKSTKTVPVIIWRAQKASNKSIFMLEEGGDQKYLLRINFID